MNELYEIEVALIGILIRNPNYLWDLDLNESDFEEQICKILFTEIKNEFDKNGEVNIGYFAKTEHYESARNCVDSVVSDIPSVAKSYAEALREKQSKLRLRSLAFDILGSDLQSHEIILKINEAIQEEVQPSSIKSGLEVLDNIIKSLDMPLDVSPTKLGVLDDLMAGGMYAGFTYGLCGKEKMGKTTFAHTISYNLDKQGIPHMYIALEMGSEQIEQRNIARDLGINSLEFIRNRSKMKYEIAKAKPRDNVYYLDAPGFTLQQILSNVSKCIVRHKIKGFIIDYWQLVQSEGSRESEEKRLRDIAQEFANFARKNKVWCLILAQQNQDGKLFGGNGLRKACDQLYMIEPVETNEKGRWLKMDASRYTLRGDAGDENNQAFFFTGSPHIESVG